MKEAKMPVLIYEGVLSTRLDLTCASLKNVSRIVIWTMVFQQTYSLNYRILFFCLSLCSQIEDIK